MKLKRYKKKKFDLFITIGIITIVISVICALFIINYLASKFDEILLPVAESQTRKVITMIINSACDESMIGENLYTVNKNSDNEIEMINYNSFEVTKLINDVTSNVESKLKEIENSEIDYYGDNKEYGNGIISEIPFGVVFGNSLLRNVGPKIKIRLNLLGDIISNIETEVKPYGINSAYVEVRIYLEVTARIVLPFVTEKIVISNVIPIAMNIVQGTVPDGYIYSYK